MVKQEEKEINTEINRQYESLYKNATGKILFIGYMDNDLHVALAQKGSLIQVIDPDEEIINNANILLFDAPPKIRRKIEYLLCDFVEYNYPDGKYDTIILTTRRYEREFSLILDIVKASLDVGGKLILCHDTEYEGINIEEYITEIPNIFSIENIEAVDDKWINIIYSKRVGESSFYDSYTEYVKHLVDKIATTTKSDCLLLNLYGKALERSNSLNTELESLRQKLRNTEKDRDVYKSEYYKYKKYYNDVKNSKRYKIATKIIDICRKPFYLSRRGINSIIEIYKRALIKQRRKKSLSNIKGVSVIIPTYKKIDYLNECVNSVLEQTFPKKIEIIISVNGADIDYYKYLCGLYKNKKRIKVVYTPKIGLSVARNFALDYVSMDYVTFLDDDDYFTKGYLEELASHVGRDVSIVCGRVVDKKENEYDENTYINKELSKISGGGKTKDYWAIGSLFATAWAKLYKTELFKNTFSKFDENALHTEDIRFWCDNIEKISGYVYCCDSKGNEALIRRVTPNSLSRPSEEKQFKFWINDRVELIDYISQRLYDKSLTVEQKRFLLNKISSQTNHMISYYETLNHEKQKEARNIIAVSENFYLNKSKFGELRGIAFCHNFAPSADASAYVAAKRLPEISALENRLIKWDVVSSDMSNCREADNLFNIFYTSFVINSHVRLPGPSYFNEKSQYLFGEKAFKLMENEKADIIYSRSMYAGSHVAAYMYKTKYPDVKWYAEFSDPIYMGTDNKKRGYAATYYEDEEFLNNFWRNCEVNVYEKADVIIFTNENQLEYMLRYNEEKELNEEIIRKSIIMNHPMIDKKFCNIVNTDYLLDSDYINIGYFGSFYPNRSHSEILRLLKNDRVIIHLFVPNPESLKKSIDDSRVRINKVVGHFEFLNIASKMDYLFLNDIDFEGTPNPYLPSKFADYIVSGARIIAKVNYGSILSKYEHENLIKVRNIDDELIEKLTPIENSKIEEKRTLAPVQ